MSSKPDTHILALPASTSGSEEEGRLLIKEAKDLVAAEPRAEHKQRIRKYTGERLFLERPRLYRLIASMRVEGVSIREITRACHCDDRTVKSVERREHQSVPAMKQTITSTTARLAKMTAQRLEEEVPKMTHQQLAITHGIATDKFLTLTGDVNLRIEHTLKPGPNIFDRIAALHANLTKIVQARVIESRPIPELTD